jgi:flagellar biogenesis protein FliO
VVEVGEQWIVVGASPGRMNALATMPRQESRRTGQPAERPGANFRRLDQTDHRQTQWQISWQSQLAISPADAGGLALPCRRGRIRTGIPP